LFLIHSLLSVSDSLSPWPLILNRLFLSPLCLFLSPLACVCVVVEKVMSYVNEKMNG
jgi:hypothetical protein